MMPDRQASIESVVEAIGVITREFKARGQYPFKHLSLGRPHADILYALGQKDHSIKELSERLHVTSGAITQFADQLESDGLVQRTEHPHDKRSRIITLTPESIAEIKLFRQQYHRIMAIHFQVLSDEELRSLSRILKKVGSSSM